MAKLLNFGVARMAETDAYTRLTGTGAIVGIATRAERVNHSSGFAADSRRWWRGGPDRDDDA